MTNSDDKLFEDAFPDDLEFDRKLELRQRAEKTLQFKKILQLIKAKTCL